MRCWHAEQFEFCSQHTFDSFCTALRSRKQFDIHINIHILQKKNSLTDTTILEMYTTVDLPSEVDVAVVGAGPTGLVAACFLRQSGIDAVVVDAASAPATTSRAAVIHLRGLQVLEKLDLSDIIVDQGLPMASMSLHEKDRVLSCAAFDELHSRYKGAIALPQVKTEATLTKKLDELGGQIYRSRTVTDIIKNDATGVQLRIKHNTTEERQLLSAKYVIAADGVHSTIRQSLDIPYEGAQYAQSFVTADVLMGTTFWLDQNFRTGAHLFMDKAGLLLVVPYPSTENNLWRIFATADNAPKNPDQNYLEEIVRTRGPKATDAPIITKVVWGNRFRVNHRLAAQYRKGHVFLAGDAAHTHSPAGAQGMNVGMQDAEHLAMVICKAIRSSHGSEADLNVYEETRRPVAKDVVAFTHRMTVAGTLTNPVACWIRNRLIWFVANFIPGATRGMSLKISGLEHQG